MDRVLRLPLGLVGGEEPQCRECGRMKLARMRGGKAEEGQRDLGVGGGLLWTNTSDFTVRCLRGAGGEGGAQWDSSGLRGVRWSLPAVRLQERKHRAKLNRDFRGQNN